MSTNETSELIETGVEETDGVMRSFWDALYAAVGGRESDGRKLVAKAIPYTLPPNSCTLAPGPAALQVSLDGKVLARAVKPLCVVSGKSYNRVVIAWAIETL